MTDTLNTSQMVKGGDEKHQEEEENDAGKITVLERQDAYVVFSNEKDLRSADSIRAKASLYTGIAVRVKALTHQAMDQLLYAIDLDTGISMRRKTKVEVQDVQKTEENEITSSRADKSGATIQVGSSNVKSARIINLRFEDCKIVRKAANILSEWLKNKSHLETLVLSKVVFEDIIDFKKVTEGMKLNTRLTKIGFSNMNFDEEIHGSAVGRIISESRAIRELDVKDIVFDYRTFYDMCQAILNERCRLNILKLRGILINEIEGKIIQFILMKNKQIHTLDLSECKTEDPANFEFFLEKMGQFCNIRYLTLERMNPDLSHNLEQLGEALAENVKLEVLVLRENRLKWNAYQNFWACLMPNKTILKLNIQKTELNDRVCEFLGKYLEQDDIGLTELDISKNNVTDIGLKLLSNSLCYNSSIKFINFSQNKLKCDGFYEFVDMMKVNTTIQEADFNGCSISNEGIEVMSGFLEFNKTLRHLDISRNSFNDSGFDRFAQAMAFNEGLTFLDIAKNKDVTEDGSLSTLCDALTENKMLRTLDLTGYTIRKPFLKQCFDQALKRNITLQEVIGKIPSNIIQPELMMNMLIEKEILPLYQPQVKVKKDEVQVFDLALVEEDPMLHSRLNLVKQPPGLIKAAFKLIRNFDIRSVDFTNSGLHDENLRMLSHYLRSDPNLRSIILDNNIFSDDGLQKLTTELNKNTKLAHLSIKGCINVTDIGLQKLCDVISTTNTSLFQIDLDMEQFDHDLATEVITESALNRDIQEKLKPVRIVTTLGPAGEVIKVVSGFENDNLDKSFYSSSEEEDEEFQEQLDAPLLLQDQSQASGSPQSQNQTDVTDTSVISRQFKKNSQPSPNLKRKLTSILQIQEEVNRTTTIVEVKFDEASRIGDCFKSALKAWRIYQPTKIFAEKQNLTDEHVAELCEFLKGRPMVSHLNLRRNQISNQGATCLGEFISDYDETLTHLDVTRNRIGVKGGQAILNALNATTRIIDCQIKFGNPISNKMGRIIEREIKANIQARNSTDNDQSSLLQQVGKYEIIDKGSDFMRCAIKMAQLQNILHLSLPDNMLNLEDTRMIADLIKRNTPLRKLNLSTNQLDADCAALIANSLIYNNNLQLLDVSKNMLGDYGVFLLLTPLIRKNLQKQSIVSKSTPTISEKELIQGKDVKSSKRLFKNIAIETNLKYLGLEENMTTPEVYKQVWLLLVINPSIFIMIEDPLTMNERDNLSLFSSQDKQLQLEAQKAQAQAREAILAEEKQQITGQMKVAPVPIDESPTSTKNQKNQQKKQHNKAEYDIMDQSASQMSIFQSGNAEEKDHSDLDEEEIKEMERQALEEERELMRAIKKEKALIRKRKRIVCCQKFCCFKDEIKKYNLQDNMPSQTQVCCWRFLRARSQATKFHSSIETLNGIEKSNCTVFVSLMISINYLTLYANVIVPFVFTILSEDLEKITVDGVEQSCDDEKYEDACDALETEDKDSFQLLVLMLNAVVLVYSMICELVIVCYNLKPSNTKCNAYLTFQLFTGFTMRAVILISAQLIAVFIQEVDIVNWTLGVVLASTLVLSQIRAFQVWFKSIKKDKNCLMPRVQQNYNICMSTNYLAAATLYKKVVVEASEAAFAQTKELQAQRELLMSQTFGDDEHDKKPRKSVKAKCATYFKCCRWGSPKFYQLIMNDIPLIFCQAFAFWFGLIDHINIAIGVFLTLFDLICMLFYLSYDTELSIQAEDVHDMTIKRISENEEALKKLLDDELLQDANVQGVHFGDETDQHDMEAAISFANMDIFDIEVKGITNPDEMIINENLRRNVGATISSLSQKVVALGLEATGLIGQNGIFQSSITGNDRELVGSQSQDDIEMARGFFPSITPQTQDAQSRQNSQSLL